MKRNWVRIFIALILFIPIGFLQVSIDYSKQLEELESGLLLMPGQIAGSLVLSGFKGLAADLLWLNIENYWHSGQHYKMLPLLEAVAWLQPNYIIVWGIGGWHMAYNIYANIGARENDLTNKLQEITKNLNKNEIKPILEIIENAKNLKEKFQKEGMPENKKDEIVYEIVNMENTLQKFQKEGKFKELLDLASAFINVPKEQLFWYENGVSFEKKGIAYNPNRYDIYFELGWLYYNKGKDYPNSVRYLEKAIKHPHPEYVDDVLAHAYEKNGQIELAIKQWEKLLNTSFKNVAERAIHELKTKGKFTP